MITIYKPIVKVEGDKATLSARIVIDGPKPVDESVFYQVDKKYAEYLCYERADAFVVAVLNFAMRSGHDIKSEAPIGEYLYYHLNRYLIDALKTYNPTWHRTKLIANIDSSDLPNAGAVGTGISCGVDSCYSLAMENNPDYPHHQLTHLVFNNVGSHGEGEKARQLFKARQETPKRIAKELGLDIIMGDSNLMDVIKQPHFQTHTYSSMFPVLCLQKLFAVYYYASSATKYHEFNLVFSEHRCSGAYETLSLPLFSTDKLRIYSQGESKSRLEKMREMVKYEPSYRYLSVCLKSEHNCNVCEKCVRTLLGLYAVGEVDKYNKVFDTNYFHKHLNWYFRQMMNRKAYGKHDYFELYDILKPQVPLILKIGYWVYFKPKATIHTGCHWFKWRVLKANTNRLKGRYV
ncbi:MAG: hypothetical protein LIP03_00580 [Bacteroidales bacterium]|nr:hypothetical protein [Bacteroidales bacterium]